MEGKALEELGHEFSGADAHFAGAAHPGEHFGMLHARALPGLTELLRRKKTSMNKTPEGW